MRVAPIAAMIVAVPMAIGCRSGSLESERSAPAPTSPTSTAYLPSGTSLEAQLDQTLSTEESRVGDSYSATLVNPVRTSDGDVAVPAGSRVEGTVTALQKSERVGERALIRLDVNQLIIEGREYDIDAEIVEADVQLEGETTRETAEKAGAGAAAGAVLGAVLSGADLDDILLGGAIGAAAGTVISLGMGDTEAALPAGTDITVQLFDGLNLERRVSQRR